MKENLIFFKLNFKQNEKFSFYFSRNNIIKVLQQIIKYRKKV